MKNFINVKNEMVWNNCSTVRKNDKMLYAYLYLEGISNNLGYCMFNLEDMITTCGIKVNTHKGKSVEVFKTLLCDLIDSNNITGITKEEILNVKPKELIKLSFDSKLDLEEGSYFKVPTDKINELFTNHTDINSINIYCYIVARCINKEYCFPSMEEIENDLNISNRTIYKYLDELEALGLVYYDTVGKNKTTNRYLNNVYALSKEGLEQGLKESYEYYSDATIEKFSKSDRKKQTSKAVRKIKAKEDDHIDFQEGFTDINGNKIPSNSSVEKASTKVNNVTHEEVNTVTEDYANEFNEASDSKGRSEKEAGFTYGFGIDTPKVKSSNAFANSINNNPFGSNIKIC